MTPQETINKLRERCESLCADLAKLPTDLPVEYATDVVIFLRDMRYAEMLTWLRKMPRTKLSGYYAHRDTLAVAYRLDGSDSRVVFYLNDVEHALAKLSNGKCAIVINAVSEVTREVVCNLQGGE